MSAETRGDITERIMAFLREIGIRVSNGEVADESFLPGIEVVNGGLVIDNFKLKFPGDLLHEAGHLAVVPSQVRHTLSGEVQLPGGNADLIESAAMSWSYAACIHLGLDPSVVFHEHGYLGRSANLLFNFQLGVFPGLHELVKAGMTDSGADREKTDGPVFPSMKKWLRD